MGSKKSITFKLPSRFADQVQAIACREGETSSAVLRRLVRRGLDQEQQPEPRTRKVQVAV